MSRISSLSSRELNQPGSPNESLWDLGTVSSDICRVFGHFLQTAPAENFGPRELERMAALLEKRASSAGTQVNPRTTDACAPVPQSVVVGQSLVGTTSSQYTRLERGWR